MASLLRHRTAFALVGAVGITSMVAACESLEPDIASEISSALESEPPVKPLSSQVNLGTEWRSVPAPQAFEGHAAVAIDRATVLVAGGRILGELTADTTTAAYLFDVTTEEWKALSPMHHSRAGHTATKLEDGRVLVVGGRFEKDGGSDDYLDTAEIFDPTTSTWTLVPTTMSVAHVYHTATRLPDHRVLIAGGEYGDGFTRMTELFDPSDDSFSEGPFLELGLGHHTATLLPKGSVLVAGGEADWSFAMDMTFAFDDHDVDGPAWYGGAFLRGGRAHHTATLLHDDRLLLVGGVNVDGTSIASAEIYDTVDDIGELDTARRDHTATLLPDGRVLVVGGVGLDQTTLATTELYDPALDKWSPGPELRRPRYGHTVEVLAGRVVVIGGMDGQGKALDDAETLAFGASLGADCSEGAECMSGFCVDGVCCDTACEGACLACTASLKASGSDGSCGPIDPNTCDPTPPDICNDLLDGTPCGNDNGCTVALCQNHVCVNTHKLNGSRCDGGVCIAGECKLDRTPSPGGASGGAGRDGSGGEGDGEGDPAGQGGSNQQPADSKEDEGGGLCSFATGTPKHAPMSIAFALIAGLGAWRRRMKNNEIERA